MSLNPEALPMQQPMEIYFAACVGFSKHSWQSADLLAGVPRWADCTMEQGCPEFIRTGAC